MTQPTTLQTSRFGEITFEPEDIVTFREGLVGLPTLQKFVVIQHNETSNFRWLQAIDDGTVAFLVVDPAHYVADYSPEMPESATCALELDDSTPILVYTICNIPNGNPKGMTLNLAGPIVINADNQCARQVVLDSDFYPVRYKVFPVEVAEAA